MISIPHYVPCRLTQTLTGKMEQSRLNKLLCIASQGSQCRQLVWFDLEMIGFYGMIVRLGARSSSVIEESLATGFGFAMYISIFAIAP